MKKFFILFFVLLFVGCATSNDRMIKLEQKVRELEDMVLIGATEEAGASFYPFTGGLDGGTTGMLDKITSLSDKDVAFGALQGDATYGNSFFAYTHDTGSSVGNDLPWTVDSGDVGTDWILLHGRFKYMYSKLEPSKETGATVTVYDYETGTVFINDDNDAIEFDLPADGAGCAFCFTNDYDSSAVMTIDPDASDYMILDGTVASQGEAIKSGGDIKDNICIYGLDNSYWKVIGLVGTAAEETP